MEMDLIEQAINEYHRRTCIKWKARTIEKDYVSFTNQATGCWSSVGRIGGRQVSLFITYSAHLTSADYSC